MLSKPVTLSLLYDVIVRLSPWHKSTARYHRHLGYNRLGATVSHGSCRFAQLFFQRKRDAYIPVSEQRAQSLLVGVLYLSEACQVVHVFSVIQAYCISVVQY